MKRILIAILGLSYLLTGSMVWAHNDEDEAGHSHEKAEVHGGTVVMTQSHHFEIVPMMNGLAVFAYDHEQNPIDVSNASGPATVILKSGKQFSFDLKPYDMSAQKNMSGDQGSTMHDNSNGMMGQNHGEMMSGDHNSMMNNGEMKSGSKTDDNDEMAGEKEEDHGSMMDNDGDEDMAEHPHMLYGKSMLYGSYDLSSLDAEEAKVSVSVSNLPSKTESSVQFRETIHLNNMPENMHEMMEHAEMHHHEDMDHHMMHNDGDHMDHMKTSGKNGMQ